MERDLLARLVAFRRDLHAHPETGFSQHQTRKAILAILQSEGVKGDIKLLAKTAITLDMRGELPPTGADTLVAFRADMDALSMQEDNKDLPHRSKNQGAAHMCGHDGHVTCLVAFAIRFKTLLPLLPSNKGVRLLFQPSQEGPESGAKLMVGEGCLQGIREVYGFHQWPSEKAGQLWCKAGPVMSEITILKITITGTGGHASDPSKLKVAVWAAVDFYSRFLAYSSTLDPAVICNFPVFHSGERYNVISSTACLEGTIRSFKKGMKDQVCQHIRNMLSKYEGFHCELNAVTNAPINFNTEAEAQHVLRVGRKVFGEGHVGPGQLPFRASEDFSFFTQNKPGAFFFLSSANCSPQPFLHSNSFDFNDDLIQKASEFWLQLALDRLKQ